MLDPRSRGRPKQIFQGLGVMLTESIRINCSFPACHSGSARYAICYIFYRPSMTLDLDRGSADLEIVLSCLFTSSRSHFPSTPIPLPSYLEALALAIVLYPDFAPQQAVEQYQPYLKANRCVTNNPHLTWSFPVKTGSLQVCGHRVGNISAGQAGNTPGQDIKEN